jgi:hypothetical protein
MSDYRLNSLKNIEENKNRIIEKTRNSIKNEEIQTKHRQKYVRPAFITLLASLLCIVIASSYVQQALRSDDPFSVDKVVIPNVPYDSLISSFYIDESGELIYSTAQGIYSFNVKQNKAKQLVDTSETGRVYELTASTKWLIWAAPVNKGQQQIHILNRETTELKMAKNNYFFGLYLDGDTLIYLGTGQDKPSYNTIALNSMKENVLHELKGDGAMSEPVIKDNLIAIPETLSSNDKKETMVYVYDLQTEEQVSTYTFPNDRVENIQLQNNTLFGYLWDDQGTGKVVSIDMASNELNNLETEVDTNAYSTDGKHFAFSVKKGDSDTVQLFRKEEDKLNLSSTLPSIRERLVRPRFTSKGTLLLNGEGEDFAMYIIRFEE